MLFSTVEEVTGTRLGFKRFGDGNLIAIIVDADAQQAVALGHFLLTRYNMTIDGQQLEDWVAALRVVLKTCQVHFKRSVHMYPNKPGSL